MVVVHEPVAETLETSIGEHYETAAAYADIDQLAINQLWRGSPVQYSALTEQMTERKKQAAEREARKQAEQHRAQLREEEKAKKDEEPFGSWEWAMPPPGLPAPPGSESPVLGKEPSARAKPKAHRMTFEEEEQLCREMGLNLDAGSVKPWRPGSSLESARTQIAKQRADEARRKSEEEAAAGVPGSEKRTSGRSSVAPDRYGAQSPSRSTKTR